VNENPWFLSTDTSLLQLDTVHGWLRESYWSPGVRRDIVQRAFDNSLAIGAYDPERRQIGVARVVTDQTTFAWICDVYVAGSWRGHGIARGMLRALLGDSRLQTLRRWCLATRDAHGVYRPLGFERVDAERWLELRPNPAGWQEPAGSDRLVRDPLSP
jgi:GNAT superfamily N-acetyltransferase